MERNDFITPSFILAINPSWYNSSSFAMFIRPAASIAVCELPGNYVLISFSEHSLLQSTTFPMTGSSAGPVHATSLTFTTGLLLKLAGKPQRVSIPV